MDYLSHAEEILADFPDDVDKTEQEVADKLEELISGYGVNVDEAIRSTRSRIEKEYDGDEVISSGGSGGSDGDLHVDIGSITPEEHDGEFFNITGEVTDLYDLSEEQASFIEQRGMIGDETGKIRFTLYKSTLEDGDVDEGLEEGETYTIRGVVGDSYQGTPEVELQKNVTITVSDESFDVAEYEDEFTGLLVDVRRPSGLIKRCPEDGCTRVVQKGKCQMHGQVDGVSDMRLKAVFDTGTSLVKVFFGKEATEEFTGMSLEEAEQVAADAVDREAPLDQMLPEIRGRYYEIAGNYSGDFVIAEEYDRVESEDSTEAATALLERIDAVENEVVA